MTSKSRVVLQDLKKAISHHHDELQSEEFRISWLTIVTLIRAVGHVLAKVDSKHSPAMEKAIDEKWKEVRSTKPEPKIFWGFDDERNRFLKNYEHAVSRSSTMPSLVDNTYITVDVGNGRGGRWTSPDAEFKSTISSGVFEGENEKELAWNAYDRWVNYLDDVDERAAR